MNRRDEIKTTDATDNIDGQEARRRYASPYSNGGGDSGLSIDNNSDNDADG